MSGLLDRTLFLKLLAAAALVLGGCSTGWNHRYDTLAPEVRATGFGKILVVTRDSRPIVAAGRRPQYVGTVKGMYGDPWQAETASGKPLAQDVSTAVCNSLVGKGYECFPLVSGTSEIAGEVQYLLQRHLPVRILFIHLREWENDTYLSTTLKYDLTLDVWNRMGQVMTSVTLNGQDQLKTVAYMNPAKNASVAAPKTMEELLGLLLSNQRVTDAVTLVRPIDQLGSKYRR